MTAETTPLKQLPFSFTKRFGILVTPLDNNTIKAVYRNKPDIAILTEIRRHFDLPMIIEKVDDETFSQLLVSHYETDTSTAMQLAEDMGETMDLFDLMHELPKT